MVTIRNESHRDIEAREDLLDRVWGASRFAKTAERLREGRSPAAGLSLVAELDGSRRRHRPAVARQRRAGRPGPAARPARGRGGATAAAASAAP